MPIIVNLSDDRFTLDGIEYFKNFTPVVIGNDIKIVNTYDSTLVLVDLTPFGDYTIDGVVKTTVALAQSALLPVLFTRESLGGLAGGTATWGTITGDIQTQTDLIELFVDVGTIENYYNDISELVADQVNQTINKVQYVSDASADPAVTSGIGWYKYNGVANSVITDYDLLSTSILDAKPIDPFVFNTTINAYMIKASGNASLILLEVNDIVWFKDVTHGTTTVTLMGWRYNGGDTTLKTSYTKVKSIA